MNISATKLIATLAVICTIGAALPGRAAPEIGWKPGNERRTNSNLKTTAAACDPANATIDLDINNVRSRLMTGGDMWWDRGTGTARYEVPKGSGKNALFAGSVWVGGYDQTGDLKTMAQQYRSAGNDTWSGPTLTDVNNQNMAPDRATCSDWDRFWKIDNATLLEYIEIFQKTGKPGTAAKFQTIREWPATGNQYAVGNSGSALQQVTDTTYTHFGRNFAPFVDVDGDKRYNIDKGDYPDIFGDQYIWWVFNDMGNLKLQTKTNAIGMEVQTASFAYATKDYLNDASFVYYRLINRGTLTLTKTYMATWTDADLGYAYDDYIGCDTNRSLGILYNGKSRDGNGEPSSYGATVPMIGVDFFQGPKRRTYNGSRDTFYNKISPTGKFYHEDTLGMSVFNYFTSGSNNHGDPRDGVGTYRIMTGFSILNFSLHNDKSLGKASTGFNNTGPETKAVYFDNPEDPNGWSECACGTEPGDRRFVHSSGPFDLEAGGFSNDIIIGACWVPNVGGCPNASFTRIRAADDAIQDLFDNHFRTIEGPESPRLVIREMDRKLIFYILNDSGSTNFQEKFGFDTGIYRVSTPRSRKLARFGNGDSIYHFQGYRIFQLKDRTVNTANIYKEGGSINSEVARQVFETDIKDSIANGVANVYGVPDVIAGTYNSVTQVNLSNTGLVHSFELTTDQFATGNDKRFVNYRNYYFVAIAFAINNFRQYNGRNPDSAQLIPYLESSHSAKRHPIPIYTPMPNPANGDMGTVLNSDYGSGVIIKRLEGIGNGGNATSFTDSTEEEALKGPDYQAYQPTYKQGEGPVTVKIVDPRLVQERNWELYLTDASTIVNPDRLNQNRTTWTLRSGTDTIYSERNIAYTNEQILEKYGLSITITQTWKPGDTAVNTTTNGYISSSLVYSDPNKAWLGGVNDAEDVNPRNWIRSGGFLNPDYASCNYGDIGVYKDGNGQQYDKNPDHPQVYENLLSDFTPNKGTWAPAALAAAEGKSDCGFGVVNADMQASGISQIPGVDIVFTSDKTKWTKVLVMELQDAPGLADGHVGKFKLRDHQSWNKQLDAQGNPVYSTTKDDKGFSYFPGYAINQETGERLNMMFGEDSYLKSQNGADMIWNPTSTIVDPISNSVVFGGKHYVYVINAKYDEDKAARFTFDSTSGSIYPLFHDVVWVGLPTLQPGQQLLSLKDGLIPTDTRIRIRVTKPYGVYQPAGAPITYRNNGLPLYSFSTKGLGPTALTDAGNVYNSDKQALLDQIFVTPNPYYGYASYEQSNLDTRVRIINLPRAATVNIYSLDGTLVRTLTKDNANVSYVDWDLRNAKGLAMASGMYLIHVKAEGIGEKVIRWFGAFRPVNITTY